MELMTAAVLLSAIATIGFLVNKYLDRKYGTKPNQELIDRLTNIEFEMDGNICDKFDNVCDRFVKNEQDLDKANKDLAEFKKHTANLFVAIDKKLTGLHLGEILSAKHKEVIEIG